MERLFKVSVPDWEVYFDSGDIYKFPVTLKTKIIYKGNFKTIEIIVGSYCDSDLIKKIQSKKIKYLKEYFDIAKETIENNIVDSLERIYENVTLSNVINDSKSDSVDTYIFTFYQWEEMID